MARSMHLLKLAAIKDVTIMLRKEEFAGVMERTSAKTLAVMKM